VMAALGQSRRFGRVRPMSAQAVTSDFATIFALTATRTARARRTRRTAANASRWVPWKLTTVVARWFFLTEQGGSPWRTIE
jgi:hypothetical protein